jgi:AraC-like DNA-binding protein
MNDKGIFEPALFREAHKGPAVRVDGGGGSRRYRHHNTRASIRNSSYQRVGGMVVIPQLLREMGVEPSTVLSRAGIDSGTLDDMENRIPYVSMGRLFHECVLATSSPYFGMSVGQKISLSHLGVPGALMRHSATLRAGFQRFLVYQDLDNQGHATFLSESEGIASLSYAIYQRGVECIDQIYDAFLATACNVMRELGGPRWTPEEVYFSRTRPADVGVYHRFFRAPCRFDRERTAIFFPAYFLDRPMPEANAERLKETERQAKSIANADLVARLRRALRFLLIDGRASGEKAAEHLFLHRRTLSRHLKMEGTTFQQVLDETRFEAARQLLDYTRIPLTEIAPSVGYSESSAFSRAFRRWSGGPPSYKRSRTDRLSG